MNAGGFIALAILFALAVYAGWLFSPPGAVTPLIDEATDRLLRENLPSDTRSGNDIETFTGFDPMVARMEEDIAAAQSYVHLVFFKYEDDEAGRRVAGLLAKKAAEGVEVRLMVDAAVNMSRKRLYRDMEAAGIRTKQFAPLHIPLMKKWDNYRNHRKIVVVDGRVAYIGGMNIADRYGKGLKWGVWRDTHIRIEGPAAADCEYAFARDWAFKGGEVLEGHRYCPESIEPRGDMKVDIVCSGPRGEGPAIMQGICNMLDRSKRYAWLESPYFIPTPEIRDSLCNAARRGVDVRVIIPPRGDRGILTPTCSNAWIAEALEAGVRIARFNSGYMHSKTVVCDDRYVTVGSTNIDPRSYILDYEINAFIDSPSYAARMKSVFEDDEKLSKYIDKGEWNARPVLQKAWEAFVKQFSAQL